MAVRDVFKISRKTFFDPRGWFGYDTLKEQTLTIATILKTMFTPEKPTRQETFEEAMQRMKLTEADVKESITVYRSYAIGFLIFGVLTFIYSFYILFANGTFTGWLLGMAASALFASQAFKYDFWAFQMRRRQLGLTFADWKKAIFGGKDSA